MEEIGTAKLVPKPYKHYQTHRRRKSASTVPLVNQGAPSVKALESFRFNVVFVCNLYTAKPAALVVATMARAFRALEGDAGMLHFLSNKKAQC